MERDTKEPVLRIKKYRGVRTRKSQSSGLVDCMYEVEPNGEFYFKFFIRAYRRRSAENEHPRVRQPWPVSAMFRGDLSLKV